MSCGDRRTLAIACPGGPWRVHSAARTIDLDASPGGLRRSSGDRSANPGHHLLARDFTGDGHPDVIWRETATGKVKLLAGNGAGGYLSNESADIGGFSIADRLV